MKRKRFLITGGTSGIGLALARACSALDQEVIICGRNVERLARAQHELSGVKAVRADLTQPDDRQRLVEMMSAEAERPLLLINNAAVQHPALWTDWTPEQAAWAAEEIALNVTGLVLLTHALMPVLLRAPQASIVNVSSGLALAPRRSAPTYCATKAFVHSFTRALRYQCEDAAPRLRVVEVLPALVDTPMTAGRGKRKMSPDAVAATVLSGLERGQTEILLGPARLLPWIQRLSPALAYWILRNG
jgi:uncharacterized oxidoreductase